MNSEALHFRPGTKTDPETGRRIGWNGKPVTAARHAREKVMFTPGPDEDSDALTGELFAISKLPRVNRRLKLAELALANPNVAPDRFRGIVIANSIPFPPDNANFPPVWIETEFTWALFHARAYRPVPDQTRGAFNEEVGRYVRLKNPKAKLEFVANLRLRFGPLIEVQGRDLQKELKFHPLLSGAAPRNISELMKLAEVILPTVMAEPWAPKPPVRAKVYREAYGGVEVPTIPSEKLANMNQRIADGEVVLYEPIPGTKDRL